MKDIIKPLKYAIYWHKNQRLASPLLGSKEDKALKQRFNIELIQTDITGTKHFEVFGQKPKRKYKLNCFNSD